MIEAFSYRLLQLEKEIHLISFCVLGFTPIIYIISSILSLFKIEKISSITKDSKHSDEIKWGSHKKVQKVWSAPWYFLSIEIFLLYLWSKRFHLLPNLFLIFIVNGDILLHFWSRRLFDVFCQWGEYSCYISGAEDLSKAASSSLFARKLLGFISCKIIMVIAYKVIMVISCKIIISSSHVIPLWLFPATSLWLSRALSFHRSLGALRAPTSR